MFVKVAINWPEVTYTQVDPDVDLTDFSMSANRKGYIQFRDRGKKQLLHRYVMGLQPGDKRHVHHVNGDVKDNRRSNLRIVTCSENNRAKPKSKRNTSGLIGVYKRLTDGKYVAQIRAWDNGKKKSRWLGSYWGKNEAGRAYDAAVRARGGDYMTLNFPDEVSNTLSVV
jgi:hypothetical protein